MRTDGKFNSGEQIRCVKLQALDKPQGLRVLVAL